MKAIPPELDELILAFLDRKYVARSDKRQKAMGLAYIEAERRDLAKEIGRFIRNLFEEKPKINLH